MKLTRINIAIVAIGALAFLAVANLLGHPILSAEALAAIGALPLMLGDTDAIGEITELVEKQGEAWEEYKRTNDDLIKRKADGQAVADLEAKLATIEATSKQLADEMKDLALKSQRPTVSPDEGKAIEAETSRFNGKLKAAAVEAGKAYTPIDAKGCADYKEAIASYIRKGFNGLTDAERKAINIGTSTMGGYLVGEEMEAGIDRVVQRYSGMRQVARVITIGSAAYKKLVKTGGTSGATRGGETTAPTEGTSQSWAELEIKPGTYLSDQRITAEAIEDATIDVGADLENEIGIELAELEGTDFISGTGVNGPRGLTTYTNVANASYSWGSVGYVASGHASSWASSNPSDYLIDLVHALKRQYRANASFIMNDATLGSIRKLKDGQGNYLWGMTKEAFMAGAVGTLLGYPVVTDDFMADIGANAYPIAFGDFQQAYCVVDRKGLAVLRDPATSFPYVKFLTRRRVGGGIVKFEAVKLFKIATS